MQMIKLRNARYCNLKLILIFLVVYGHLIENMTESSYAAELLYRTIYFLHMPVFAFTSGLFVRDIHRCKRQLYRSLAIYVLLQTAAVILSGGKTDLFTPYWHLWYLLSLCMWLGAALLWFRFGKSRHGRLTVLLCALAGCAAGFVPWVGRVMSLSRTAVFLPYFMAGVICGIETVRVRRSWALPLSGAAIILMVVCSDMPVSFLYQATPYINAKDLLCRIICYIVGAGGCAAALFLVPDKRYPFTKIGADTIWIYLLHAPMVLAVRVFDTEWYGCILIAAAIIFVLYRITQWCGGVYGIACERRAAFGDFSKNL